MKAKKAKRTQNNQIKKVELEKRPNFYKQYSWSPIPDDAQDFVGREIEFLGFWNEMAKLARSGIGKKTNYAFIGQRKLGKTAYLKRCYNIAFWEQDEIIPFYYSFAQNDGSNQDNTMQLSSLREAMPLMFLTQFFTFYTKDETFFEFLVPDHIFAYLRKIKFPKCESLIQAIQVRLEQIAEGKGTLDWIWQLSQDLSLFVDKKCLLIIDEAQEMDISIYDGPQRRRCKASISDIIQKDHSLVFVSGSNVSMLVNNFLDHSFANRFERKDFTPLKPKHAKELIRKRCPKGYKGLADNLLDLVGGNPDYINKILSFNMNYMETHDEDKDFSSKSGLQKAYDFEVLHPKGRIYYFWQVHLKKNKDDLNRDPKGKKGLAIQLLYKISRSPSSQFSYAELAQEFQVDEDTVVAKVKQLEQANLIEPTGVSFSAHAFSDKVLSVIINNLYHHLIIKGPSRKVAQKAQEDYQALATRMKKAIDKAGTDLKEIASDVNDIQNRISDLKLKKVKIQSKVKSAIGKLSLSKGVKKENNVRKKIRKMIEQQKHIFSGYKLEGEVASINIRQSNGTGCEIDIFAKLKGKGKKSQSLAFLAEVKNTKKKVSLQQAQKFVASVKKAMNEYKLKNVAAVYISTSGFAVKAEKYLTTFGIECTQSENILSSFE